MKNTKMFPMKISIFTAEKQSLYIAWASFHNVTESPALISTLVSKQIPAPTTQWRLLYFDFFIIYRFIVHLSLDKYMYMTDFCLFVRYNQVSHCSYFLMNGN